MTIDFKKALEDSRKHKKQMEEYKKQGLVYINKDFIIESEYIEIANIPNNHNTAATLKQLNFKNNLVNQIINHKNYNKALKETNWLSILDTEKLIASFENKYPKQTLDKTFLIHYIKELIYTLNILNDLEKYI